MVVKVESIAAAVPEPTVFALLLVGLAAVGLVTNRGRAAGR